MSAKLKKLLETMAALKAANNAMDVRLAKLEDGETSIAVIEDEVEDHGTMDADGKTIEGTAAEGATRRPMPSVPGVDPEKFSFAKAVQAINTGDWSRAGYEQEVFSAARKALNLNDDAGGGFLVPMQVMEELIPLLRSALILPTLGVTMMSGLNASPVEISKQRGGGTGYWVGEEGSITESEQDFGIVRLRPHKAGALTKVSNTILRAGGANAENTVRTDLAMTLARTIQKAFFQGTGFGAQPLGVENHASINSVAFGGVPTVALLQRMIEEIDVDDAMTGSLRWAFHPRMKHKIAKLVYGGAGGPILTGPRGGDVSQGNAETLLGIPYSSTSDITLGATTTSIFLAVWMECLLGDWGALELLASNVTSDAFIKDQTWIRAIQEVDVGVRHEESICVSTGAVWTP